MTANEKFAALVNECTIEVEKTNQSEQGKR